MTTLRSITLCMLPALLVAAAACGDDGPGTPTPDAATAADAAPNADAPPAADGGVPVPDLYAFPSKVTPGASSVAYTGQTFRHILILELGNYLEGLTSAIDSGFAPADGEILAALEFYYRFDATTGGEVPLTITASPATKQVTYGDVSPSGANLFTKVAGAETDIDHKDWTTQFTGWSEGGASSPRALVAYWFGLLDDLARDRALGTAPLGPDDLPIGKVYVTAKGQDLKQLLMKFLLGAVAYHQATDKYLDSATPGKGLLAPNTQDADKPYTLLEHAWDEGFGYWGGARDYGRHSDAQNASPGYFDTDGDGAIDLKSEFNFGASTNAAKRDLASSPSAPTDFSKLSMDAFLRGRTLISSAQGGLTPAQLAQLEAERDVAVANWEMAIAATIVHYLNQVIRHMDRFGAPSYKFLDHAKHWSEAKGFALGLQFNPRKKLTDAQLAQLHALLGDAPVLPTAPQAQIDAYRDALLQARAILKDAYGFADANVGDANGENGW